MRSRSELQKLVATFAREFNTQVHSPMETERWFAPNITLVNADELYEIHKIRQQLIALMNRLNRPAMSNGDYYGRD